MPLFGQTSRAKPADNICVPHLRFMENPWQGKYMEKVTFEDTKTGLDPLLWKNVTCDFLTIHVQLLITDTINNYLGGTDNTILIIDLLQKWRKLLCSYLSLKVASHLRNGIFLNKPTATALRKYQLN